jgi:hypothetical protein
MLLINLLVENLMIKKEGKKKRQKGFTLIELMIVNAHRERSYMSICVSDSKNAFTAAQSYFLFQCDQWLHNIGQLYAHGFTESSGVTTSIVPGKQQPHNLEIKSTHDASGVAVIRSSSGYTVIHWVLLFPQSRLS